VIERVVRGQHVNGTDRWLAVSYGDERRFVASGLVKERALAISNALEIAFVIVGGACSLLMIGVLSSERLRTLARGAEGPFDLGLFSVVLATGLLLGVVAFVLSQADGQTATSFFSAAFANLGAGFVGAAIVFVVFQALLSKRAVGVDDFREEISSLRAEVKQLPASWEPGHGTRRRHGSRWRALRLGSAAAGLLLIASGLRARRRP
jgi:hypothetical protein